MESATCIDRSIDQARRWAKCICNCNPESLSHILKSRGFSLIKIRKEDTAQAFQPSFLVLGITNLVLPDTSVVSCTTITSLNKILCLFFSLYIVSSYILPARFYFVITLKLSQIFCNSVFQ